MADFKDKLFGEYDKFQTLSVDFDKTLSRYIMVASGASIAIIVNKFDLVAEGKFLSAWLEVALWLFTVSVVLSGICLFLNARLSSKYAKSYSFLYVYVDSREYEHTGAKPYFYVDDEKFVKTTLEKVEPLNKERRFVMGVQILSGFLFAVGFVIVIALVTALIK